MRRTFFLFFIFRQVPAYWISQLPLVQTRLGPVAYTVVLLHLAKNTRLTRSIKSDLRDPIQ